jgi:hypothetical protein
MLSTTLMLKIKLVKIKAKKGRVGKSHLNKQPKLDQYRLWLICDLLSYLQPNVNLDLVYELYKLRFPKLSLLVSEIMVFLLEERLPINRVCVKGNLKLKLQLRM